MPVVRRVLVGVDGSLCAAHALDWAIALAERFGAEVIALHALGLLSHLGSGPPVPSHEHRAEVAALFESAWCAPLRASGVAHRARLLDGPAAPTLLAAAETDDVDVIVMGSRGIGGAPGLRLGSCSQQVAEHSSRPVLVVPAAAPTA